MAKPNAQNAYHKLIGVDMAVKAAEDAAYQPSVSIFDEFSLQDRVALVTGGYGGLGLETCVSLFEAGAIVYAIDLPSEPSSDFIACQKFAETLKARLYYRQCDVTEPLALEAIFHAIQQEHGRLDVCVAAAGILGAADGHDCDAYPTDEFRKVMDINCNGVYWTARAAAKVMKETRTPGSIILIASMSGSITNRSHKWVAYNTSKSAVLQMARSMACELGHFGIRVNSLSPGHIYTKMTAALLDVKPEQGKLWANANPLGRLGAVHELRGAIAWLASDAATFCTGSDIQITGGHTAW